MTAGMNCIILTAKLRTEKQMWLMFICTFSLSDKWHHSTEGVPSISVSSNTHFVINTKHGPYKFFRKETTQTNEQAFVTLVSL
jgi:hypothetical protein